jgi:hypothetical protein
MNERVLAGGNWHEPLAPGSLYEEEFETIVRQEGSDLFPNYVVGSFKVTVASEAGLVKPDLAVIDPHYRRWWVVEVELATHSLRSHVLPQIHKLVIGDYGVAHARYLARELVGLSEDALATMMKGAPPGVIVVVNDFVPAWEEPLKAAGADLFVVRLFRSGANVHLFHVAGALPSTDTNTLSLCHRDALMPNMIRLDAPGSMRSTEVLEILYKGAVTYWKQIESRDTVWLAPLGRNPLSERSSFRLVTSEDGLCFEDC